MRARLVLILLLALAAWPLPRPAAAQADPSFNLVNRSGQAIHEVYVSPVREQFWGRDWLGADVLPNGRAWPIRLAPSAGCSHDIRVVYADGRSEERRNTNTCGVAQVVFGSAPPPAASPGNPGENPSFNLVNHGRGSMREVYVSSAREETWGNQRLPRTMQPGEHLAVRLREGDCVNDIRVIWSDGRAEERRAVNTCQLTNIVFQ